MRESKIRQITLSVQFDLLRSTAEFLLKRVQRLTLAICFITRLKQHKTPFSNKFFQWLECLPLLKVITCSVLLCSLLWVSDSAQADIFFVNTTLDGDDSFPGDGVCSSLIGGQCTLRAAIQEANAWSGSDTIELGAATYILTESGVGEDAGETGDLDISGFDELLIRGVSAADTIVDGNQVDRVFHILSGAGKVTLERLRVRGGRLSGNGAGLFNAGFETIIRFVEISENLAVEVSQGQPREDHFGIAGGVYNDSGAGLIVDQSYIAYNNARNREFFDRKNQLMVGGGGIYNVGTLEVRNNSRIEDNIAQQGGGILNLGIADINDSIVAFNSSEAEGGGIFNWGGVLSVRRSIVSDNDCGVLCGGGGAASRNRAPRASRSAGVRALIVSTG